MAIYTTKTDINEEDVKKYDKWWNGLSRSDKFYYWAYFHEKEAKQTETNH